MKFSASHFNENKYFFASVQFNVLLNVFKQNDEIFYVVLQQKQAIGQLFAKDLIFFLNILQET